MENIQSELYLYTIRQKTSVKRGGTNPKAKNYKSVSKSILFETAPPRTMFGFVQRKIMSDPILRTSKKKFARFLISPSEIQKP